MGEIYKLLGVNRFLNLRKYIEVKFSVKECYVKFEWFRNFEVGFFYLFVWKIFIWDWGYLFRYS